MDIISLSDGSAAIPPEMLLSKPAPEWPDGFLVDGLMPVNFGGFFVRVGGANVVIDTGFGSGTFLDRLPVAPSEVDHVVFTHLHWDHVGWATDGKTPRFGRAEHHCHAIDWDYWCGPHPHEETAPGREDFGAIPAPERLAPLASSIARHTGSRVEILPGLTLRLAPGHTPGHCIVELDGAAILADAAHNPAQLLSDDWTSSTDEDASVAGATRAALAAEFEDSGVRLTMTHWGSFGTLVGGRRWVPEP